MMKKNFLILIVIGLMAAVTAKEISAQTYDRITTKKITLVSGKELIVRGEVRDSDEIAYTFKARAGQRLTVKVIGGRDADFCVNAIYEFGPEAIDENRKSWSDKLPVTYYKKFEVVVHSNYKVADFILEITLK